MSSLHWITFFEFDTLLHLPDGTIVYMVLAMVAIATFFQRLRGGFGRLASGGYVSGHPCYYHPVDVELVTAESELNSTVCSLMIVLFSVFTITIILNVRKEKAGGRTHESLSRQLEQAADHDAPTGYITGDI